MLPENSIQGSLFDVRTVLDYGQSIVNAAQGLVKTLLEHRPLTTRLIHSQMTKYFLGSDAEGVWSWRDAYNALEVALLFYLRHKGTGMLSQHPLGILRQLEEIETLLPTHTRRSEEQVRLQQFSTPLPLAYLVAYAGHITNQDVVLEPSAGTGMLAQWATLYGAQIILNEIAEERGKILQCLFPRAPRFCVNAEQIHDYLGTRVTSPSVVLMNPPFSASLRKQGRAPDATVRHVLSALARLGNGGRLVTITAEWFSPRNPAWREAFVSMQERGATVVLSVGIQGEVYRKHGTTIDTRLTVIDKVPTDTPSRCACNPDKVNLAELLTLLHGAPQRLHREQTSLTTPAAPTPHKGEGAKGSTCSEHGTHHQPTLQQAEPAEVEHLTPEQPEEAAPLHYEVVEWNGSEALHDTLYERYRPQRVRIHKAQVHPSLLCESAALALVSPPAPTYTPLLPPQIVGKGILSEAQLESLIYAGQAHAEFLSGFYLTDESFDTITVTASTHANAVQFRRGWFLGDGTGAGKGRQVAGIILDNWCRGRKRAIWISKSAALIEDARRDWCAVGGSEKDLIDLSHYKLGTLLSLREGIIFTTYTTLRSQKDGKSRLHQLVEWAGKDFDGVIAFDECHAMGNAMAEQGKIGLKHASLQGTTGVRLQHALPNARVVYVSATGATKVSNLAYASRLGLWQTGDFPFSSREDFVQSIEAGGIAAMEVVARDLKALGLYLARSLSFEGVEYETIEIELTPTQENTYDSYAQAFQVIHRHLQQALKACNISGAKTYNRLAKMSAMSQFESHKQRFFNHLLVGMKCPALIRAIEHNLAQGNAVVVQLVTTNEELLKRKLDEIPVEEWKNLTIDLTPREYVMDYLISAFPIHLHEIHASNDGEERSEPVYHADGSPVISQEACALRDALIAQIGVLDPIPGALEHLLWHFGHQHLAEVTGRSTRILKDCETGRLFVEQRSSVANMVETHAFMNDEKQILVFSDAGGTGRSYHADRQARNQRRRIHYLLESGWRADNAIQGLGRSHRTNQASAPLFCPVTTNVKGERRFISTIARRLDSLGALTRGQRQTGGNGIFSAKDNLESCYAEKALSELYSHICHGRFAQMSVAEFESLTGLELTSSEGGMKVDLPPLRQFLNRLLALPIGQQNLLFDRFDLLLTHIIEAAVEAGIYEMGVETLHAEKFVTVSKEEVYTHTATGSVTYYLKIERTQKADIKSAEEAVAYAKSYHGQLMVNAHSGHAAICTPTTSIYTDDGGVTPRVLLVRPQKELRVPTAKLQESTWKEVSPAQFMDAWTQEVKDLPQFTTDYIHLISGTMLPIWNVLPRKNSRVYRLQTSDGENILGRVIEADEITRVAEQLGMRNQLVSPEELVTLVLHDGYSEQLPGGITLRRSLIAEHHRLELVGAQSLAERLTSVGCFTEIIQWRTRVFIPTNEHAASILAEVLNILG